MVVIRSNDVDCEGMMQVVNWSAFEFRQRWCGLLEWRTGRREIRRILNSRTTERAQWRML